MSQGRTEILCYLAASSFGRKIKRSRDENHVGVLELVNRKGLSLFLDILGLVPIADSDKTGDGRMRHSYLCAILFD